MNKNRKRLRLKNYDYSKPGAYFITICVKNRKCVFGEIRNGKMFLNEWGKIVHQQWEWLHHQYDYLIMDEFVVMPNHFHAILIIADNIAGNGRDRSLQNVYCNQSPQQPQKIKPVPELIGAFKTTSSKLIHQSGLPNFKWQKSYYEHIIRNEHSMQRIRKYIIENPQKWESDLDYIFSSDK